MAKCRQVEGKRDEFLTKLRIKLIKADDTNEDLIKVNKIVSDMSEFLKNETSFETNQEAFGMRNVFRGIRMKSWTGNNFETNEDRKHNKIIVKESACFAMRARQMDVIPCTMKKSERKNVFDEMMNGESEATRHVERTKLDIDQDQNESIRSWTLGALKMKRKLKKHPQADVRTF